MIRSVFDAVILIGMALGIACVLYGLIKLIKKGTGRGEVVLSDSALREIALPIYGGGLLTIWLYVVQRVGIDVFSMPGIFLIFAAFSYGFWLFFYGKHPIDKINAFITVSIVVTVVNLLVMPLLSESEPSRVARWFEDDNLSMPLSSGSEPSEFQVLARFVSAMTLIASSFIGLLVAFFCTVRIAFRLVVKRSVEVHDFSRSLNGCASFLIFIWATVLTMQG